VQDQSLVVGREREYGGLDSVVNMQKVKIFPSLISIFLFIQKLLLAVTDHRFFSCLLQNQKVEIARGKREGNALTVKVNGEKEIVVSSPLCSEDDHYQAPSMMTYHDDTETPESDGLEDLWKDMSLAMECSKVLSLYSLYYLKLL